MRKTQLAQEATNYINDNIGLIPEVWTAILLLEESTDLPGRYIPDGFMIWEILNHWMIYWQDDNGEIIIETIKPIPGDFITLD